MNLLTYGVTEEVTELWRFLCQHHGSSTYQTQEMVGQSLRPLRGPLNDSNFVPEAEW